LDVYIRVVLVTHRERKHAQLGLLK
jgi:hypothetical protein